MDAGFLGEVIVAFALGALGAVPFLHTNTILAFLDVWVPDLAASPLFVAVLAFSHLAFETLPGVFFGVPTEGQGVSALPAHALVRQGQGRTALEAVLSGLLGGLLVAVALAPAFWFFGPGLLALVRPWTAGLLAAVVVFALAVDGLRPLHAVAFVGFGALGLLVFGLPLREPLFPLLAGLFGLPAVFFGGSVARDVGNVPSAAGVGFFPVVAGGVLGGVSVFLPALSPSFLSALALLFLPSEPVAVLAVSSAVASSRMVFDFSGVLVLHTARSAPTVVWRSAHVDAAAGLVWLATGLLAFVVAWVAVSGLWRRWLAVLQAVPFSAVCTALVAVVALGAWVLDGPWGVFALAWSAAASVLALRSRVPRKYALGCLMVPAVLHAWGI